jgi:histidine triad (HIT) family protein
MTSLFSKIIAGELPSHRVYDDESFVAFLDINPIQRGHTLLVPRLEVDCFFDCSESVLQASMPVAQRIARAIEQVIPCNRIGVMIAGLDVPHAHVHLVPIQTTGDLSFAQAQPGNESELAELAIQIQSFL